jgi:protein-S-isoprenylcysteine O-methyltransferase Ste14
MDFSSAEYAKCGVIVFAIVWGFWEKYNSNRNRRNEGVEYDKGCLRWIFIAVIIGVTSASVFSFFGGGGFSHFFFWFVSGLVVIAAGFVVRLHAMKVLANHFTYRVTILKDHTLIDKGLYRYIRHPSYLGQIIMLVGIGLSMANLWSLLFAPLPIIVVFLIRIHNEEKVLSDHFGVKYEHYRQKTRKLIPLIW